MLRRDWLKSRLHPPSIRSLHQSRAFLRLFKLRPLHDLPLDLRSQIDEFRRKAGHADHQIVIVFRVLLGVDEHFLVHDIVLDLIAAHFEIRVV